MRKITVVLLLLALPMFADLKKDIGNISFVSKEGVKVLKVIDNGSLYVAQGEVVRGAQKQVVKFYVTKDKKSVIFGKGFTAEGQEIVIPVDVKQYMGKEAFKVGSGKSKYFVFTDPECPYCKKFEEEIKAKNLTKNGTFYFYLYPLSFHKEAVPMNLYILSKKGDAKRWKALTNVEKEYKRANLSKSVKEKAQKELDRQMAIANEIGIQGTPTVYDINGKQVNWTELE